MKQLSFAILILFITLKVTAQTVYVTKSGKKYHTSSCSYARSASSQSLNDAVNSGLTPCSRCNPSSNNRTITTKQSFSGSQGPSEKPRQVKSSSGSVQCSGQTKKGSRCSRMTTNANGRCYQH
jgi:hypothetical protein